MVWIPFNTFCSKKKSSKSFKNKEKRKVWKCSPLSYTYFIRKIVMTFYHYMCMIIDFILYVKINLIHIINNIIQQHFIPQSISINSNKHILTFDIATKYLFPLLYKTSKKNNNVVSCWVHFQKSTDSHLTTGNCLKMFLTFYKHIKSKTTMIHWKFPGSGLSFFLLYMVCTCIYKPYFGEKTI